MKKERTDIIMIIDKSESMHGLEDDVISGYHYFLEEQRKVEGEAFVTTVFFNQHVQIIQNRENIHNMSYLTKEQYQVSGNKALLDAIGISIKREVDIQRKLLKDKVQHVIFVIMSDGYDNASQYFTYHQINKMICLEQEKYGWEFVFLGTDIDAIGEAKKLGIDESRTVQFCEDSQGIELTYEAVSTFTSAIRNQKSIKEWKNIVEKDTLQRRI